MKSSRRWNLQVHIGRFHGGIGQPIEVDKSSDNKKNDYVSGLNKTDSERANRSVFADLKDRKPFPSTSSSQMKNKDLIDKHYQIMMEEKESFRKLVEIRNFYAPFSQSSFDNMYPADLNRSNTPIRRFIEPPVSPEEESSYHKKPPIESDRKDNNKDKIVELKTSEKRDKEVRKSNGALEQCHVESYNTKVMTISPNEKWILKRNLYGDWIIVRTIFKDT